MSQLIAPDLHVPATGGPAGGGGSFSRILVPVDSFGQSAAALPVAAQLATTVGGGQLRIVHVRTWDPYGKGPGRFFFETSAEATAILERALTGVWASGATASGVVVEAPRSLAATAIATQAASWQADLIVVARRPRSPLGILLLGSPPDQVMRVAHCPVLVVRQDRQDRQGQR